MFHTWFMPFLRNICVLVHSSTRWRVLRMLVLLNNISKWYLPLWFTFWTYTVIHKSIVFSQVNRAKLCRSIKNKMLCLSTLIFFNIVWNCLHHIVKIFYWARDSALPIHKPFNMSLSHKSTSFAHHAQRIWNVHLSSDTKAEASYVFSLCFRYAMSPKLM